MNRDALVVGINQYPFLKDTPTSKAKHLSTPANDAEAIAQRLEEYGGFRVRRLPETIQEGQRRVAAGTLVQTDALEDAIIRLFNPVGESVPETALLYFGGHGLRKNRGGVTEGFLATSDTHPQKNQWGVSLRWLRELLQKSPVRQQIVWLDCCYSGELLNFAEADLGTAGQDRTRFLIAAAREFEVAEGDIQGQHGVFSQALWQGLDPSKQPDGVVNNDKLIEYIAQALKDVPQQPIWYNPNREIILTGEREQVFIATPSDVCPYKGLRFFDVEDATYFYGREALTEKLIERVQIGKGNFLAVLGVSGSGKSSLLRAGLIYQLQQERRLPGTEEWKIRIFTPGEQPLVSLATAFLDEDVTDIERAKQLREAQEAISQGTTGLARLIRVSKSPRTLLIVDQFEEVFTVCQNPTDRQQFISSLLGALKLTGDKLCLIFAMRDDFLGKCAAYRELTDLMIANLVMVTPMPPEELRRAIREPSQQLGRKVEENLINAILKDLGVEAEQQTREPEPGMLPLLSYTLEQLWQRQTLNWLKLDSYNLLGGVQKTLENLAEQAYKKLSVEEQRVADQIFIKLTQLGEGTPDTRKQVPQKDLVTQAESAELVERVIQKLAEAKLIVTSEQRKGQEKVAVVDVAHEALIRHWSRLRELLDNNREAIRTERKIQTAAEEWQDKGKSKDYLLTGLRLGEAEKFLQDDADIVRLSGLAKEFIEESGKESDRLLKEEKARQQRELEQERKARKAAQTRNTILATSVVIMGAAAIFVNTLRLEAERQKTIATLREKAALAENLLYVQPVEGLVLAIQATDQSQSVLHEVLAPVQASLRNAIKVSREQNLFKGHQDSIWSIAFSPDGQTIVSGSNDNTVRLWNLKGEAIGQPFQGHQGGVYALAFSPDGKYIASGSTDNTIRLWNLKGEQIGNPFLGHQNEVSSVAFSPDGKYIVSSSFDNSIRLWNLKGEQIDNPFVGHQDKVISVTFSPDGKYIVSASRDKTIRLWNLKGEPVGNPFVGHQNEVASVAFSPDGNYIVSGSADNTIRLWNLKGEQIGNPFVGHQNQVTSVAFSPDGKSIISGSFDNTVRLWNLKGKQIDQSFEGHQDAVYSVAFSRDAQHIASGSKDKTIRLWNSEPIEQSFEGHEDAVYSVTFSPDGRYIVSGSKDKTLRLWNLRGEPIANPFIGHQEEVTSVAFSPNSQYIVSASGDQTLRLWNLKGEQVSKPFIGHPNYITSVAFSPDGQSIISGSLDMKVRFWNLKGESSGAFRHEGVYVTSLAISPNGKYIVTGSNEYTVRLWNLKGELIQSFNGHQGNVRSVAFSPDSQYIVSGSFDNTVRLWNLKGQQIGPPFVGHQGYVMSVSFSPDAQYIISGSVDKTVRLWNLKGEQIGQPLTGHQNAVMSVAFSPDGQYIVSGSEDNTVRLWRGGNWKTWLQSGCDRLRDHPVLKNPETDIAKGAKDTCEKYVWSKKGKR